MVGFSAIANVASSGNRARVPFRIGHVGVLATYVVASLTLGILFVSNFFTPELRNLFLTVGAIAIWRYSWQALHYVRAVYYLAIRLPRLRKEADALGARGRVREFYVVVTSFRIETSVTLAVFRALLAEAHLYGAKTTIVASITDAADEELLGHLLRRLGAEHRIELVVMYQTGQGKRPAMAEALRAIARRMPGPDAVVALMDGDVIVEPGTLAKCMPFFKLNPRLGALTVNNRGIIQGGPVVSGWYDLRFAQRNIYMSSAALSRRLLVLTGRFSLFRASIATEPSFIGAVEEDYVGNWRHGPIRLLTGDDKSTWFWVLRHGWEMLYVADAAVVSAERLPDPSFVKSSLSLMHRWYGNMLRANVRALPLGPRKMGLFTWWCLVDQRISMWTTLVGPTLALITAFRVDVRVLAVYVAWVMSVRLLQAALIATTSGNFDGYHPVLLYYNQLAGALVKVNVLFRLERQSCTRQGISTGRKDSAWSVFWHRAWTGYTRFACLLAFVVALCFYSGALHVPDRVLGLRVEGSPTSSCVNASSSCSQIVNRFSVGPDHG